MPTVRRAREADRETVHRLQVASIRGLGHTHYDAAQVEAWASAPTPEGFVLLDDQVPCFLAERGEPAGIAQVDLDRGRFEKLYVHPDYTGEGVATALLDRVESTASEHGLSTLTLVASLNAIPFYERAGYEGVEATIKRLPDGQGGTVEFPCVRMEKWLEADDRNRIRY